MEKLSENKEKQNLEWENNTSRQKFKLSSLEILFGGMILLGLMFVGYFILSQDGGGSIPKLEKRIKLMASSSQEQFDKIEKQLKAIQESQVQLESRLKNLELRQKQQETASRELIGRISRTSRPVPEEKKSAQAREKIQYKVRKGETLLSIAKKFKVTKTELAGCNNIDRNKTVRIGELLIIYPR